MRRFSRYIVLLVVFLLTHLPDVYAQYDKDVFSMRGRLALSDGKYADAINQFNIVAVLDTADFWNFFYRGIAKYNLGDLRGAKNDFNRAVQINPVFTTGYHYRGITNSRSGDYEAALEDLQRAIELRPGIVGLYFSRGVTYFLSQQFEKAVADFDKYIRKEPKDPSAYLNRGASYLFLKDTLKAVQDYNKAIKLDRFDPEGYVRRGRLYAASKDYEKAVADMNMAIELDTTNTFAYFNRALMHYETQNYYAAMSDLNKVLEDEPGNALTLYNRGLISAQLGDFEAALTDLDRVLSINPENVLAYFNRASVFIELGMYQNALDDYDMAIELYPDFAKAYLNRSYVKNLLGRHKSSKADYDIAQKKVEEYRKKNMNDETSLADTTKKYSNLLSLDAEFAKKDFNDELLQHRDIDVKLRDLYRFVLTSEVDDINYALNTRYRDPLLEKFVSEFPVGLKLHNETITLSKELLAEVRSKVLLDRDMSQDEKMFLKALLDYSDKQYNLSLNHYGDAIDAVEGKNDITVLYSAFYSLNRAVLRAEMIEFISSIENNVQVLSMDDKGATRARVKDQIVRTYDYGDAIEDLNRALKVLPSLPYIHFNLGNLYCLSAEHLSSIESYTKAIELYPYMADAYFNRGLVLIYLKDKEKGCIDLSRAGELGIADAYGIIKKYCEENKE